MYKTKHKVEDRSDEKMESQEGINTNENYSLTAVWTCLREDKNKNKRSYLQLTKLRETTKKTSCSRYRTRRT